MQERRQPFQIRAQARDAFLVLAVWACGLTVLMVASVQQTAPINELFLDPAYLTGSDWYTGLLSNIGILCWSVAATAAAGGGWVASRFGRPAAGAFLAAAAALSLLMLTDDLLGIHTRLAGPPSGGKVTTILLITAPAPVWAWIFRREILRTRYLLLVAAAGGFAVSMGADFFLTSARPTAGELMLEDGAKFLGVLAWAQYFVLTTVDIIKSVVDQALAAKAPTSVEPVEQVEPVAAR